MSNKEKYLENKFNKTLATSFLYEKLNKFPLPWTIDSDWTSQVIDSKGNVVAEFPASQQWLSVRFIAEAEKLKLEMDTADAIVKGMYPDMDF
jgi:hypothetical protein